MLNALFKIGLLVCLSVLGLVGLGFYSHLREGADRLAKSEQQVEKLNDVIGRLEAERRVADLIVAEQSRTDGVLHTRLIMVEYDRAARPLPPRAFEVVGDQVHVDALVIKFDNDLVRADHPMRGRALLLFEKLYGDAQPPAQAARIDPVGGVPGIYRDVDPNVSTFEQKLWHQFWQLADDPALRQQLGVKVAHGAGVFAPFKPGIRYTVTLAADGNVTLYDEPLPPVLAGLLGDRAK